PGDLVARERRAAPTGTPKEFPRHHRRQDGPVVPDHVHAVAPRPRGALGIEHVRRRALLVPPIERGLGAWTGWRLRALGTGGEQHGRYSEQTTATHEAPPDAHGGTEARLGRATRTVRYRLVDWDAPVFRVLEVCVKHAHSRVPAATCVAIGQPSGPPRLLPPGVTLPALAVGVSGG